MPASRLPLILAPTRFEYSSIKAAVQGHALAAQFECIGIGPGALWRWASSSPSARSDVSPPGRLVILAGLSGALDPALKFGAIASASRIVAAGADFARPSPSFVPPVQGDRTTVIASVDEIITTVARKAALFKSTGAGMVDMESAAFASLASQRGWNWGVIRVVSDDANSDVPDWICTLLRSDGSVDMPAMLAGIAAHPSRLRTLRAIAMGLQTPLKELVREVVAVIEKTARPRRTLVFGGTFDPPHRRHAEMVTSAARLLGCDRIIIVPTGRNPLKSDAAVAHDDDRIAMVQRAFAAARGVEIDTREMHRAGPSFTVNTLREIAKERGLRRDNLVLLIGSDQALQFDQWKEWREIDRTLATIAVVARPPNHPSELTESLAAKFSKLGEDGKRWKDAVLPLEPIDVSASAVRNRLRSGQAIDDLVQPEVETWIREHMLYS